MRTQAPRASRMLSCAPLLLMFLSHSVGEAVVGGHDGEADAVHESADSVMQELMRYASAAAQRSVNRTPLDIFTAAESLLHAKSAGPDWPQPISLLEISATVAVASATAATTGKRRPKRSQNSLGAMLGYHLPDFHIQKERLSPDLQKLLPDMTLAEAADKQFNSMARGDWTEQTSPQVRLHRYLQMEEEQQDNRRKFSEFGSRPTAPSMPFAPAQPGAPAAPAAPASPANPEGGLFEKGKSGVQKVWTVIGQEGYGPLDAKMKKNVEMAMGQIPGTYQYDSLGAGVMGNRQEGGKSIGRETNLCYALLETWMRSCSTPSLVFTELGSTTSSVMSSVRTAFDQHHKRRARTRAKNSGCLASLRGGTTDDDGWGDVATAAGSQECAALKQETEAQSAQMEREMQAISMLAEKVVLSAMQAGVNNEIPELFNMANDLDSNALPDADPAYGGGSAGMDFWGLWDTDQTKDSDPDAVAAANKEKARLEKKGEKLIAQQKLDSVISQHAVGIEHLIGKKDLNRLRGGSKPAGPGGSKPLAPVPPLIPFLDAIFGGATTGMDAVLQTSEGCGKMVGAMERAGGGAGSRALVGTILGIFAAFLNMGSAHGERPGFASAEAYDPHGPYGPEPFPFQTPGSEKCHRFLTTWLNKCEK